MLSKILGNKIVTSRKWACRHLDQVILAFGAVLAENMYKTLVPNTEAGLLESRYG